LPGDQSLFRRAYLENDTLADAVRCYVNELFGDDGIIVIDPDNRDLKSYLTKVVKDDLFNHTPHAKVRESSTSLENLGYKAQINSRPINFFYLEDGVRERIVDDNEGFKVLGINKRFTREEILKEMENFPERFSPNVILRPVYQEIVLPNLIYIGGPAEVDYWLQLKGVFDVYDVPLPIIMPRNFALFVDHVANRKLQKTGAGPDDLFTPRHKFQKKRIAELSKHDLDMSTEGEEATMIFTRLESKASKVDVTLGKLVRAELSRAMKGINRIAEKMSKAEKRHHTDLVNQIDNWHEMLYPNGKDQERTLNFLNFQVEDPEFLSKIKSALDPFDLRYHVVIDAKD